MLKHEPATASQGAQITTTHQLAAYNVLGAFETMSEATKAIEALGLSGIEGQRVTLQGDGPDEADLQADTAAADSRLMKRWFGLSALWGLGGLVLGAAIGIPVGLGVIAAYGWDISLANLAVSAAFGAVFGGLILWLVGVELYGHGGHAWELSYHQTYADKAVVGVHSANPADVDKARDILQRHGAINVRDAGMGMRPHDAVDATQRMVRR